jgi:HEAT repeat protein
MTVKRVRVFARLFAKSEQVQKDNEGSRTMNRKKRAVSRLLLCFLIYLIGGVFSGLGQPRQGPSIQELLALTNQASDPGSLEILVKALERKKPVTSQEVTLLMAALDDPRWEVQRAAAIALGNTQVKEAVPKLIGKLEQLSNQSAPTDTPAEILKWNQNALVAEAIVAVLALINDDRAIEPLLNHPEFYMQHMGATPLAAFGAKALPAMLKIASDPQDPRRQAIHSVIANIRDTEAIPLLVEALTDNDVEIRKDAISALRGMRAGPAAPAFEKLLSDADADARLPALLALVEMQPEQYFDRALLFLQDASALVRGQVIDLLARLERVDAVTPIEKMLKDPDDIVKYKAAKALEKLTGATYPYKRTRMIEIFEDLDRAKAVKN